MKRAFKAAGDALFIFWIIGIIIYSVIYIYRAGGLDRLRRTFV
jgi:hypothetical protein